MSADKPLNDRDIIVVGGAGYIGAHVCKTLSKYGANPITFDNLSSGHAHAVKWGPLETVDLRDAGATEAAFQRYAHVETVIHLASSIEVGIGETHPAEFYQNNVLGAMNLLNAMRKTDAAQIIFSSTCATYGETDAMPLTENQPQIPLSTYGKTKLAIEHMIESYHKAYGLKYVTLRYFNAAGADEAGEIGEEHDPETHLIPIALRSAMGLRGRMKIFGTDYDTPDGSCIRDYIHVSDIALAHVKALLALDTGLAATSLNIGTGNGVSNLEVLQTIERVTGLPLPYDPAPRRGGDLSRLYADGAKAKAIIGFEPQHSGIETIIKTAWNFHKREMD
ncbi:UDP-glucose 4-epimerase GalE [Fretibacter rubidus]|uniref:UDP-glucose 4-epimerase GalE n=1 Tax=Fretibacter rubidus TaxID=570162 RepID=UPI00352AB42E